MFSQAKHSDYWVPYMRNSGTLHRDVEDMVGLVGSRNRQLSSRTNWIRIGNGVGPCPAQLTFDNTAKFP